MVRSVWLISGNLLDLSHNFSILPSLAADRIQHFIRVFSAWCIVHLFVQEQSCFPDWKSFPDPRDFAFGSACVGRLPSSRSLVGGNSAPLDPNFSTSCQPLVGLQLDSQVHRKSLRHSAKNHRCSSTQFKAGQSLVCKCHHHSASRSIARVKLTTKVCLRNCPASA